MAVEEMTVEEVVQYRPWNFGKVNVGAGQVGIYQVKDSQGRTWFALIKDYRAMEGDWRIVLIGSLEDTEGKIKDRLMMDNVYGLCFMEYLFTLKK